MSAVTAQLGDSARIMDSRESYEQTYNAGCNYAGVGDWAAAEEALTSAETAARKYWEDEEEEIEEEVGIIKVQLGYVMQRQGKDKEAQAIYNQVWVYRTNLKVVTFENNIVLGFKKQA